MKLADPCEKGMFPCMDSHPDRWYNSFMISLSKNLEEKKEALLGILSDYGRVAVAFSAGVDSTVVAKAVSIACGDNSVAITAKSLSLASGELEEAIRLAEMIGIKHLILETEEFQNPDYIKNAPDRCYFCKTELYSLIEKHFDSLNVDSVVNGANLDDRGDHRPGMEAASEHQVRSPLIEVGINKAEVRELAQYWELPIWDKPATPCLSSRIAYGLEVTAERIRAVDQAEAFLKSELKIKTLRVRYEQNDLARIEVPVEDIPRLFKSQLHSRITEYFHSLGFQYVTIDLEGFRSGSMNSMILLEDLRIHQ